MKKALFKQLFERSILIFNFQVLAIYAPQWQTIQSRPICLVISK